MFRIGLQSVTCGYLVKPEKQSIVFRKEVNIYLERQDSYTMWPKKRRATDTQNAIFLETQSEMSQLPNLIMALESIYHNFSNIQCQIPLQHIHVLQLEVTFVYTHRTNK